MDRTRQLGEEGIPRLLFRFSIPAIVGMIVSASYSVVDRIFIGQAVGSLGIAGVTIGFSVMLLIMAFGMLIGIGATTLISIRLGEGKKEEAEMVMGNALTLLVLVSLFLTAGGLIFLKPLLSFFGASETVLPYAAQYIGIILIGSVFAGVGFGANNFIRADGSPRTAMVSMFISALTNAALASLFIFAFHWGMRGAAWATVIAQAVTTVWVLLYFTRGKSTMKLRRKNLRLKGRLVSRIIILGSAPFFMQIAAAAVTVILNKSLVTYGGDVAVSAMGIIYSVTMMILMPIFGINHGAQPIIGYNYGAKKFDRVKKTLKLAILAASAVVFCGFTVAMFFPEQLIRMFNSSDKELLRLGTQAMRIYLLLLPIVGFQIVSSSYFQAVGKPREAMILSLLRQVVVLIPAILILPRFFGLTGVFMTSPLSDLISSVLTAVCLCREVRILNQKIRAREEEESGTAS
ncbi:MAG: MATE family efflux transporter [bacterium]